MEPWLWVVAAAGLFGAGYWFRKDRSERAAADSSKALREKGREFREQGQLLQALRCFSEAAGAYSHYVHREEIADTLMELGRYDQAAYEFGRARRLSMEDTDSFSDEPYPGDSTYLYYREILAYKRCDNWEFVYKRACDAVELLRLGELPRMFEGRAIGDELVATRMVGALHHLEGHQALEKAREDAHWLLAESDSARLRRLAKSVTDLSDVPKEVERLPQMDFEDETFEA